MHQSDEGHIKILSMLKITISERKTTFMIHANGVDKNPRGVNVDRTPALSSLNLSREKQLVDQ